MVLVDDHSLKCIIQKPNVNDSHSNIFDYSSPQIDEELLYRLQIQEYNERIFKII